MEEKKKPAEEEEGGKKVSKDKYLKLKEEVEKAKADEAYWKNEYYRVFADTQNLRKSLEDDRRNAIKYRAEGFLEELLPALDGFHAVLESPAPNKEIENYLIGFRYIYNQIVKALENEGVSESMPTIGDRFDATCMHAIETIEDDGEEGRVLKVHAKGYKLHDRLIRPAMVSVSKKKEEKNDEPAQEEVHQA